jgi:hypothetical protein
VTSTQDLIRTVVTRITLIFPKSNPSSLILGLIVAKQDYHLKVKDDCNLRREMESMKNKEKTRNLPMGKEEGNQWNYLQTKL